MLAIWVEGRYMQAFYMLLVCAYNILGKGNPKLPWERLAAGILFQVFLSFK